MENKIERIIQNTNAFNKVVYDLENTIILLETQGKVKQANKKRNELKGVLETFIANLENQKIW